MSGGRMPYCPASASKGFSSTPVKTSERKDLHTSKDLDDGVLSDDEDTFSLLSPIYHDSFDSDEDLEPSPSQRTSPHSRHSLSPLRCELPRTPSSHLLNEAVEAAGSPPLSAWELWLVNKAKDHRLRLEKKAEEELILKENKEKEEREREQKRMIMEKKIQRWLIMKREQDKHKQLVKQSKVEETQREQEKQREIEQKAQLKYNNWLQKKNQEKIEAEKKEKEDAALKEEQAKERRKRAEEKFKEWLAKANEKSRPSPKSSCYLTGSFGNSYPSTGFYNPIPWKPIHIPPPEPSRNKMPGKKPQRQRKSQQSSSTTLALLRNSASTAQSSQRR